MKRKVYLLITACSISFLFHPLVLAQQLDCRFKAPVLKIDFGNAGTSPGINIGYLSNYHQINGNCPDDGFYTFTDFTSHCFNGDWITLTEDHTPGDYQGRMMLVNASHTPGTFFQYAVGNLIPNTTYEFSAWVVNVCRTQSPCNPTPPTISFLIQNSSGNLLAKFKTGTITATNGPDWQRYFGEFTLPQGSTGVIIRMNDDTDGGCGNDFAIDDIMLRECILRKPEAPKPPVVMINEPLIRKPKPVVKETKPVKDPAPVTTPLKKNKPSLKKEEVKGKPVAVTPVIKNTEVKVPVPKIILSRSNPVIKQIETPESELLIELYDNGEIDGDTVTIYHNNSLVVANAGLSEKPVSFKVKVDAQHPHHELVMTANNLGSIPPNTSLMVITVADKRYEVFISSSEQKNAKIVIDLRE